MDRKRLLIAVALLGIIAIGLLIVLAIGLFRVDEDGGGSNGAQRVVSPTW